MSIGMLIDDGAIDTLTAPEIYADGVSAIQSLQANFRVYYFTYVPTPDGRIEKVIVAKIVRPKAGLRATKRLRDLIGQPDVLPSHGPN